MDKRLFNILILVVLCKITYISCNYHELFRYDYKFHDDVGWIKFYYMPMKFEDAVLKCHYEGAILASPLNEATTHIFSSILGNNQLKIESVFTGISDIYSTGEFQSMEGLPLSSINLKWALEPNIQSTETCIAMHANGTVSVVPCSDRHAFICLREKQVKKLNECGTVDQEYVLNNQTGSCYKVSQENLPWSEAFKICAIEGGHLAIINSQTEAEVLWALVKKLWPNGTAYLGIRAWGVIRAWITVQGQSLDEAGFSKWYKGEPNNAHNNEACGSVFVGGPFDDGILNDVPCNMGHHFICEIETKLNIKE